jgi:membrane protein implicated in regulation of membrane protease activity
MSYPNSALSAWQLAIMAVVAVTALAVWLTAVFLAAREPRPDHAAAASSGASAATGTTAAHITRPGPAEDQPPRQADRKAAA